MEEWRKNARHEPIIVDLEALVPKDHLLRKIEKIMDYEWLYERLDPYYCHDNGRPGTDPVVLIKMVLIQHLFGIPSLRHTCQRIQDTISYRWFLGYGLLDKIPHFATVSYAFCRRFPDELTSEIFEHILNKALNNRMLDPSAIFIDGTHIKASANKKKFQKEQVAKAALVKALREEGYALKYLLAAMELSKSTYYYEIGKTDKIQERNADISSKIESIFQENKARYGVRRVCQELARRGFPVNHKRVQRIMSRLGLAGKRPKEKYHSYRGEVGRVAANVINRDFSTDRPLQKWTTDISQFTLPWGKYYLSPILDMNTNEIISYNLSLSLNIEQIKDMLHKAFERFPSVNGLIMHLDQGWQYQHATYRSELQNHKIIQSMSMQLLRQLHYGNIFWKTEK